jgi:hypothetical protein
VAGVPSLARALVMNGDGGGRTRAGVLPRALPHPNVLGGQPEHGREREAGIRAVPYQAVRPSRLAGPMTDQGFSPPYKISYRGLKLPSISAAFAICYLRL